jgi:hypothetical protein
VIVDASSTRTVEDADDVHELYAQELKELRQGIGCTPERLWVSTEVASALRRRLQGSEGLITPQALVKELELLVRGLSNPVHREPLLSALGFIMEHSAPILSERRRSYNESLRNARDPSVRKLYADIRTLERRENEGIRTLIQLLVAPIAKKVEAAPSSGSPRPRELALVSREYDFYFSPTGAILRQEVSLYVRALVPDAEPIIDVTAKYFAESRPGTVTIEACSGCEITELNESPGGTLSGKLKIYKRLRPEDGIYPLSHRLIVNSTARAEPIVYWHVRAPGAKRIAFKLNFDIKMKPSRAWWFASDTTFREEIEPNPGEGRHLELLNNAQYVYRVFEKEGDLAMDCDYGIAWIWEGL